MAINSDNQSDNKIQINIDAEKTAFNDKIAIPDVYRDMAKPSESLQINPFKSEFTKTDSFNPFQFEKNFMGVQNENPITLESQTLKFDQSTGFNMMNQSSLMTGFEENKNLQSVTNLLASQQLSNTSLAQQPGLNQADVNKHIQKAISTSVVPALENVSQYVQQMSNLNTDHKNIHDELPTISPTNLFFTDVSASAMDIPTWS